MFTNLLRLQVFVNKSIDKTDVRMLLAIIFGHSVNRFSQNIKIILLWFENRRKSHGGEF